MIDILINGRTFKFLVDTGASVNVMNEREFEKLQNVKLHRTSTKIYGFGNNSPIELRGMIETPIIYKGNSAVTKIFVTSDRSSVSLLSYETSVKLGILNEINHVSSSDIYKKFPKLF